MKDNSHITHGYRINFNTPREILRSLFMVHNESVNIWSHFVPALLLIAVMVYMVAFVDTASFINDFRSPSSRLR
jgi:adiponectin receptor